MSVAIGEPFPSANEAPRLTIGLLWHSLSSGNLGVGALTLANMELAKAVARQMGFAPRFVIFGMRDGEAPPMQVPDVETVTINAKTVLSPTGYWRRIGQIDCMLDIGAGDSFADIYGPKRFAFLWLTKYLAELRRVPLVMSPQTIGPFTRPVYRLLAGVVMRRASAVIARDEASLAAVGDIAKGAHARLSVDVAFELPFEDQRALRGGPKLRIGINPSGLLFHQAETGRNRFGLSYDYAAFTRRLIEMLLARDDVELHLVPHATSKGDPTDDDSRTVDRLAAEFSRAVRVPNFTDAIAAKSYISGLDFLVGARMHACIAAFSAGTPVVPVAYSRKFSGLFGLLEYPWLVPVSGLNVDQAVNLVVEAIERREQLCADRDAGMARVASLLDAYREELRSLFGVAGGRVR